MADASGDAVWVYSRTASGDAAPLRTIAGASTGLDAVIGVVVDHANDELLVAKYAASAIVAFDRTASGDVPPLRTLSGAATGLNRPVHLWLVPATPTPMSASGPTSASSAVSPVAATAAGWRPWGCSCPLSPEW